MNGKLFCDIREAAGASRKEFAQLLGVESVAAWEDGLCLPSRETMQKVEAFAEIVHVDCSELKKEWNKRMSNLDTIDSIKNPFERIRHAAGLTRKEFAKELGVKTVMNWESGKCFPNFRSMKKIVEFCTKCEIDYSEAQRLWKERNRNSSANKCAAQRRRWDREKEMRSPAEEQPAQEVEVKKKRTKDLMHRKPAVKRTARAKATAGIRLQNGEKPAKRSRRAVKKEKGKRTGRRQRKQKQGCAAKTG